MNQNEMEKALAEVKEMIEALTETQQHVERVCSTIYHDYVREDIDALESRILRLEKMML